MIPSYRSIRVQLTAWAMVTILVLTGTLWGFIEYRLRRDLTKQYDRFLRGYAEDLLTPIEDPNLSEREIDAILDRRLASFRENMAVEFRAVTAEGRVVYASAGWGNSPPTRIAADDPQFETIQLDSRWSHRMLHRNGVRPGVGAVYSQTAVMMRPLSHTIRNYRRNLAFVIIALLTVSGVGAFALTRRALAPAVAMARAAEGISAGNPGDRLPLPGTRDELDELADTLNGTLDRLEDARTRIELFATDLAHELRTPITQLVGETERALVSGTSEQELRTMLEQHAEIYTGMRRMLTDLLGLLRPGGAMQTTERPIDVRDLVGEVLETFTIVAEEKQVTLRGIDGPSGARVLGDDRRLVRAITNLVDNAIGHTPAGGQVTVTWFAEDPDLLIEVRDTGVGIPAEFLPRVFDRFFRRSTSDGRPGFGLGLAICQRIAQDHHGEVEIESEPGVGTTVRVRLPLARG